MIRKILRIFVILALINYSCSGNMSHSTDQSVGKVRYLALGDSYTIGESVPESKRFPVQLADSLADAGYDLEVEIVAKTGWSTGQLTEAISKNPPQGYFQLVTLLIGVNNQYRGLDTAGYRHELRALIRQSVAFAGDDTGRVIVVSIPDYSVTPFAINMDNSKIAREIDAYNAIKKEECEMLRVAFVNITPVSRQTANDCSLLASDGLHPSAKMYRRWVNHLLPTVLEILR